jgi:hypothetical protein
MNLIIKTSCLLFSLFFTLTVLAAEPHLNLIVDPKYDYNESIHIATDDHQDLLSNAKAWLHHTDDDLMYIRVQYTITNTLNTTMYAHQWRISIDNEVLSDDVIALIQPSESQTFSRLVFGGSIQTNANQSIQSSISVTGKYQNPLVNLSQRNNLNCPPYEPWCSKADEVAASHFCMGLCTKRGQIGYAKCDIIYYRTQDGEQCETDTITCVCSGGNNPESLIPSLPEFGRDRDLDPYITELFQEHSTLNSRPTDFIEQ